MRFSGVYQPEMIGEDGRRSEDHKGFSTIELLVTMVILIILAALSIPNLTSGIEAAKLAQAIADLRTLQGEITRHEVLKGSLPQTLADLGRGDFLDPWGRPYEYMNFAAGQGKGQEQGQGQGQARKDKGNPINSRFDLYSQGKDGKSQPPLQSQGSQDDVIVGRDGGYIGLGAGF